MVSGESIVHCRCVAGGLGGLRLIFFTFAANEKRGQLIKKVHVFYTNPCNAPTVQYFRRIP